MTTMTTMSTETETLRAFQWFSDLVTQLTITDKLRNLNQDIEGKWFTISWWPGQHLQFLRCFFWGVLKLNRISLYCNFLILKTKIYTPEHLLVHVRVKVQLIESSHLLQVCATLGKRFGENYKRFFWATRTLSAKTLMKEFSNPRLGSNLVTMSWREAASNLLYEDDLVIIAKDKIVKPVLQSTKCSSHHH